MIKVAFFPYHPDLCILAKNIEKLMGYEICGFLSYKEDAKRIHALNASIGLSTTSYEAVINECDIVILCDNYRGLLTDKYIRIIEYTLQHGKEIFALPVVESQVDFSDYKGQYRILEHLPENQGIEEAHSPVKHIRRINTPIIGIVGQGECCGKFENQILVKTVLDENYETIAITSNPLGALFGHYTTPSILFEEMSFTQKIIKYNQYVRGVEESNNPDAIVLGIPGGIAPYNARSSNNFAEYPLVVSSAVPIDLGVLCVYYNASFSQDSALKEMIHYCKGRFEIQLGAISVSSTYCDFSTVDDGVTFEHLSREFMHRYHREYENIGIPVMSPLMGEEAKAAIRLCVRQLQENVRGV